MLKRTAWSAVLALVCLAVAPAVAGDVTDDQPEALDCQYKYQLRNHETTEPFKDGHGGINRNQTIGESGPHGDDYDSNEEILPLGTGFLLFRSVIDGVLYVRLI